MQTVTIVIDQEGGASVGVGCVKGKTCKAVTAEIEKALGKTVGDQLTAEYHEVENAKARH
jgi:Tfp pilus assembly protein PilZ